MRYALQSRGTPVVAGVLVAVCLVGLFGCRGGSGSLDQLVVTTYRYNFEDDDIARVYGLARNTGEERTPPADIVVTLLGRAGSNRGQDRTELPALRGGEEHEFSMELTIHRKATDVKIDIVPRGEPLAEEAETEDDSDEGD